MLSTTPVNQSWPSWKRATTASPGCSVVSLTHVRVTRSSERCVFSSAAEIEVGWISRSRSLSKRPSNCSAASGPALMCSGWRTSRSYVRCSAMGMYVSHLLIIFFSAGRKWLKRCRQWLESSPPGRVRCSSSYRRASTSTSPACRARSCAATSASCQSEGGPCRLPRNLTLRAGLVPSRSRRTRRTCALEKASFMPR